MTRKNLLAPTGQRGAIAGLALLAGLVGGGLAQPAFAQTTPIQPTDQSGDFAPLCQPSPDGVTPGNCNLDAADGTVNGGGNTSPSFKKVEAGQDLVQVDNGFAVYQGFQNSPTLSEVDIAGASLNTIKLRQGSQGTFNGNYFAAGGIVFGPCTAAAKNDCIAGTDGTVGVGVLYGEQIIQGGGAGSSDGGWVSDDDLHGQVLDSGVSQDFGSIAAVAIDPVNGAYAVGWRSPTGVSNQTVAVIQALNPTNYTLATETDLSPLAGGSTTQALGINKNASLVVGMAELGKVEHAVYAAPTATSWTDLTTQALFPTTALGYPIAQSTAIAANNSGEITGELVLKEAVPGTSPKKTSRISVGYTTTAGGGSAPNIFGFSYNVTPGGTPYNVIPLKVLSTGQVVGNLEFTVGTTVVYHPFVYDPSTTTLTDFGLMNMPVPGSGPGATCGVGGTTCAPAESCKISRPNDSGEVVGNCIAQGDVSNPYGAQGTSAGFYINVLSPAGAGAAAYEDLDSCIHSTENSQINNLANYSITNGSSIDDAHELSLLAYDYAKNGSVSRAGMVGLTTSYNVATPTAACPY